MKITVGNTVKASDNGRSQLVCSDSRGSDVSCSEVANNLSWAFDSEPMDSNLRDVVSEHTGDILIDGFFQYDDLDAQLIRRFGDMDHRRYLLTRSRIFAPKTLVKSWIFGKFGSTTKNIQGIMLCSASRRDMLRFDPAKFRSVSAQIFTASVYIQYVNGSRRVSQDLKKPTLSNDTSPAQQHWNFLSFAMIRTATFYRGCTRGDMARRVRFGTGLWIPE